MPNEYTRTLDATTLRWFNEFGYGYYPVHNAAAEPEAYWTHYLQCELTEIGLDLNEARLRLVKQYTAGKVLDIGVGCGSFIKAHGNALGYDVDPQAVAWLQRNELWFDPYFACASLDRFDGVTLWDSLEHLRHPEELLQRIGAQCVFVSLPIFQDIDHVFRSKHYKPREHYHYFTAFGLIRFMAFNGFRTLAISDQETRAGREDILTFVFQRYEEDFDSKAALDEGRNVLAAFSEWQHLYNQEVKMLDGVA